MTPRWKIRRVDVADAVGAVWLVSRDGVERGLFGVWENAVTFAHLYATAERVTNTYGPTA